MPSFKTVPLEYIIRTTSDWTTFQIVEGGFWSDVKIECLKGQDKLDRDIVYSDKRIEIHKKPVDKSLVEAKIACRLNIYKDYLSSDIRYLIEKGDVESTVIRTLFKGKEVYRLENYGSPFVSPENPVYFSVPVATHPPPQLSQVLGTALTIVGLLGLGYLATLLASLVYCAAFALDFVVFARSNPYIIIGVGAVVGASFIATFIAIRFRTHYIRSEPLGYEEDYEVS